MDTGRVRSQTQNIDNIKVIAISGCKTLLSALGSKLFYFNFYSETQFALHRKPGFEKKKSYESFTLVREDNCQNVFP